MRYAAKDSCCRRHATMLMRFAAMLSLIIADDYAR